MNRHCFKSLSLACLTTVFAGLSSCVDDSYDLSKDVDMTVTIGGEATLPGSNTEEITLKKILDLDANSNVKADANGNYQLTQSGNSTSTSVSINAVTVNGASINSNGSTQLHFTAPAAGMTVSPSLQFGINASYSINQNITTDVVALKSAATSIPVAVRMSFNSNSGKLYIERGTTITFPEYVTLTSTSASGFELNGTHQLVCNVDKKEITNNMTIAQVSVNAIDFTKVENGGLPRRGNLVIGGTVSISGKAHMENVRGSVTASVSAGGSISSGTIKSAVAKVDPSIKLSVSPVKITDLPDFLSDDQVTVNLNDPKVFITVDNPTPVDVNLSAELVPVGGSGKTVKIGNVQGGTAPVLIPANSQNYVICLHRQADKTGIVADEVITVANMNDLIEKIPDEIRMNNIVAKATDEFKSVTLGSNYTVKAGFHFEAPLQLLSGSKVVYTDRLDGWNSDMEKISFTSGEITLTATNKIPLALDVTVEALDKNGNKLNGVTAVVDKQVAAGTAESPATTDLVVTIKSASAEEMTKLDGIEYHVTATTTDAVSGTTLNENQTVKFDNVRVKVKGGVTVDMN